MDPVAQQFLADLDAASEELPRSVQAGLVMCGDDVVPGLVERVLDGERPVPTRAFAAQVLAELKVPAGWEAMARVVAGGSVVMLPLLGRLLSGGGQGAAEAALAQAEDASLVAEVRLVLAGLAVRAAGTAWAGPRASRVAMGTFADAPGPALSLMRMAPNPDYLELLRSSDRNLLLANPEAALEVMLAGTPEDNHARMIATALTTGLDRFLDDTLDDMLSHLEPPAPVSAEGLRDEP